MKKIITLILTAAIILTFCLTNTYAENEDEVWPKSPDIEAPAAILMDAATGTILYGKNIDERHYPASTTKILTAIIAIENSNLTDMVTFSHDAIYNLETGATHIGLVEGEEITMQDCLYALLLASANEVANGIAEHIGGSIDKFADMMNEYAKNIGCTNSHFVNPNGLHDDDHYTTCYDLALISRYALNNSTFKEIDGTKSYTISETNMTDETRSFSNHHQMLTANKEGFTQYKYDGCIGGKTGYTSAADHVLVTFATRNDTTLIAVVMDTSINGQYEDSIKLLDYGFDNFKSYDISQTEGSNTSSSTLNFFNRYYNIANSENYISTDYAGKLIIPKSLDFSDITKNIEYYPKVNLVEGENNIGKITYSYGDIILGVTDITLNCSIDSHTPVLTMPNELSSSNRTDNSKEKFSFKKIIKITLIVIGCILGLAIIILLLFFIIHHLIWKKKQRHRRNLQRDDYFIRTMKRKKDDFRL